MFQNLSLWFNSWEVFIVEYGFTTINVNSKLIFKENIKYCILNMGNTCLSLDGSNGNHGGCQTMMYYYEICFLQLAAQESNIEVHPDNSDD
jgi:hypothetical protein